jgi:hypothetical protein
MFNELYEVALSAIRSPLTEAVVDGSDYGKLYHGSPRQALALILKFGKLRDRHKRGVSISRSRKSAREFGDIVFVLELEPGTEILTGPRVREMFLEYRRHAYREKSIRYSSYRTSIRQLGKYQIRSLSDIAMDEVAGELSRHYDGVDFTWTGSRIRARDRWPGEREIRIMNEDAIKLLGYYDYYKEDGKVFHSIEKETDSVVER